MLFYQPPIRASCSATSIVPISDLKQVFMIFFHYTTTHSMSSPCHFGGILSGLFQLIIHPPPGGPNRVVHPMSTKISTHHHHWPARTNARHVCGSIERKMVTIGLWNRSPGHVVGCVGNALVCVGHKFGDKPLLINKKLIFHHKTHGMGGKPAMQAFLYIKLNVYFQVDLIHWQWFLPIFFSETVAWWSTVHETSRTSSMNQCCKWTMLNTHGGTCHLIDLSMQYHPMKCSNNHKFVQFHQFLSLQDAIVPSRSYRCVHTTLMKCISIKKIFFSLIIVEIVDGCIQKYKSREYSR